MINAAGGETNALLNKNWIMPSILKTNSKMNKLEIGSSLDEIFQVLRRSNKYIDETMPWVLAKDENEQDKLILMLKIVSIGKT